MTKADKKNSQQQLDFLNENLATINKDMLLKASMKDVLTLLDKKANHDEIILDVNYLKSALSKQNKEFKQLKDD